MKHFVIQHTKLLFLGVAVFILLIGVWFKLAVSSAKPDEIPTLPNPSSLTHFVQSLAEDSSASGVLFAAYNNDKNKPYVVLNHGLGDKAQPLTVENAFHLGTASHALLSVMLLHLDAEGVIKLDDALAQYVPDAPHASVVTLKNLVANSSGIADYKRNVEFQRSVESNPSVLWNFAELIAQVKNEPLAFIPGTEFRESATNGVLLGEVLTRATGKSISKLLTQIFSVSIGTPTQPLSKELSYGFRYAHPQFTFKSGPTLTLMENWNMSWAGPSGFMSTDIFAFAQVTKAIFSGDLLTEVQLQTLIDPSADTKRGWRRGLGVWQYQDAFVIRGTIHGVSVMSAYVPEHDFSFAVMANLNNSRSGAVPAELIGKAVIEKLYGMR